MHNHAFRRNYSGRTFIDFPSDKDRLYHVWAEFADFKENMVRQIKRRWTYAKRLNMELSRKIANAIVTYAGKYQADVLVFEYLEIKGLFPERNVSSFICGENGIFRIYASIRLIDME